MGGFDIGLDINETGLLTVSWALSIAYGILVIQLSTYLQNRKRDPILLQGTVVFLFLNETVAMILYYVAVHYQVVKVFPGTLASFGMHVTGVIMNFFCHLTMTLVNLFLIWRYHRFSQKPWLSIPLVLTSLTACAMYFYNNYLGLEIVRSMTGFDNIAKTLEIHNASAGFFKIAAALDFTIVAAVYVLLLIELIIFSRGELIVGKKLIKRLIFLTLESGSVTVALAAASLANTVARSAPDPTALVTLIAVAARTYYMTMLFNLNCRNNGAITMADPTLGHISSQLRTQPSVQLSDISSFGGKQKQTVVHVQEHHFTVTDTALEHHKTPHASEKCDNDAV